MKVAINNTWGGFGLNQRALQRLRELGSPYAEGHYKYGWWDRIPRHDPLLIQVIEELGDDAGDDTELAIVEIPDGIDYVIEEYDGWEHVAEPHRHWRAKER